MPRLWSENIASHRREVQDAILDAAVELIDSKGVANVTMGELATGSGIGRATLYKYFPNVSAVLSACHYRQVERHVAELHRIAVDASPPERLAAVLRGYALRVQGSNARHAAAGLIADDHAHGRDAVEAFVEELVAKAAVEGSVRTDVAPRELAAYCVHALQAAGSVTSRAAADRIAGLVVETVGLSHLARK